MDTSYINNMYSALKDNNAAQAKAIKDQQVTDLRRRLAEQLPKYQTERAQADVGQQQNFNKLKEYMGNSGAFHSGDNLTRASNVITNRNNAVNQTNANESEFTTGINNAIADAERQYALAMNNINNSTSFEQSKAMIDFNERRRTEELQKAREAQQQSNWQSQFDYGKQKDSQLFDYQKLQDAYDKYKWESQFNYQKDRDSVGDKRWETEFGYNQSLNDRDYRLKLQQLAASRSGGGGGGSSSASAKAQTDSDKKSIWNEFYSMTNPTDRERWLNSYRTQIINALGSDEYKKLYNELGTGSVYNYSTPAYLH